jgi:hypothetical protein
MSVTRRANAVPILPKNPDAQMWLDAFTYLSEVEPANFTPDLHKLSESYLQLLFVMDQLTIDDRGMLGQDAAVRLGYGFSMHKYSFWRKRLAKESFGIPLEECKYHAVPEARIKGTLMAVSTPNFWEKLDFYYQNGVLFERKRIRIVLPYVKELAKPDGTFVLDKRSCFIWAWAYFGVKDYWKQQLDAGFLFKPVHCFSKDQLPNSGVSILHQMPYYRFTTLELKD